MDNFLIFSKALQFDPLAVTLVLEGVKPASFIILKYKKSIKQDVKSLEFKIHRFNQYPKICFFYFIRPGFEDQMCLMIFNEKKTMNNQEVLNKIQKSWTFKSFEEIINLHIEIYQDRIKTSKMSEQQKVDLQILAGMVFGYPRSNVAIFGQEVKNKKMLKKRKGYYIKSSPSLAFIGYESTKKQSENLIEKWLHFKKNKMKLAVQKAKKKLMLL